MTTGLPVFPPVAGTTPVRRIGVRRCGGGTFPLAGLLLVAGVGAPPVAHASGVPVGVELAPVVVVGHPNLADAPTSATEGSVTAEQLAERPVSRAGELLEFVPGLMVTQHSGEGKANQYFLRGFNLDHGTDFSETVDGLPVNMRTHAHGQGYADLNFVIPELIGTLDYAKGPYDAEAGDFSAAGTARLRYVDALPRPRVEATAGSFGYRSLFAAGSPEVHLGDGHDGRLLLGAQGTLYSGPFAVNEDVKKLATVARYNEGDARKGFTASLMTYNISYNAPDQISQRAVDAGSLDRYGAIDPTDGGNVQRHSLNAEWRGARGSEAGNQAGDSRWQVQGYALRYRMQLYSNFTYFLDNPVNGDQFNQFDDRWVYGVNAHRDWVLPTPVPASLTVGAQGRFDDIRPVGLYDTANRSRLDTVREDRVKEGSLGLYVSSTQRWRPWFRSTLGARVDGYTFDVHGNVSENSGHDRDAIVSPKVALVFGPWARTRVFLNYGEGFHSNDARGVVGTGTLDPNDGTPQPRVTPLVKARGSEIGVTSALAPNLAVAASLWQLRFASELVYVGDEGTNEPSAASRRRGIELSAFYTPAPWLTLDADYAYAHARLAAAEGDRIPNSIGVVYGFGVTVPETRGISAGVRLRHLGAGPLIEDGSAYSRPTTVVNAQVGYHFAGRYRVNLLLLNAFDSRQNDITYYYASRLPGEPAEGVNDYHFHPVEPRAVRVTLGVEL